MTGSIAAVPTGNLYDKYGSANPLVRRLMARFEGALEELLERAEPTSILDVGCGEGVLTERWARRLADRPVLGLDLDDPKLAAQWAERRLPNLRFGVLDGPDLPLAADTFDCACAIEVLEHVPDPDRMLGELTRCATRHVLVSVPREPLWRALNVARGAYLRQLGNTPGHLNHWSRRAFVRLVGRYAEVLEVRTPAPWTVVLARVPSTASTISR